MESLLSSYASSDDEEPQQQEEEHDTKCVPTTSKPQLSCLPQPKSSFLPQPKQNNPKPINSFSALPKPKTILQIKPNFASSSTNPTEDDDDDDDKEKRHRKEAAPSSSLQTSSVTSFLATIPAPRNSSSLGSGLSSGRKAIIDTVPTDDVSVIVPDQNQVGGSDENVVTYDSNNGYAGYEPSYDSSGGYGGYGVDQGYAYEGYGNNWSGNVGSVESESAMRVLGKRGRKDKPIEIVEVKQDELMKNRPREDQVKSTGIAFGPSYKPVSAAGKPSKLHKRKHQIGSLYFEMKAKEMELQDRRAKGFLTKAETHAKYGW